MDFESDFLKICENRMKYLLYFGLGLFLISLLINIDVQTPMNNIPIEIDVPPVITIEELGYNISYVKKSKLNENKNKYHLTLCENEIEEEDDVYFSFSIEKFNNLNEANKMYETNIGQIKVLESYIGSKCIGCNLYKNTKKDVLDYVIELDELNVDRAHIIYDWFDLPQQPMGANYLFLQKDNIIIKIGFNSNLVIEEETLKLFVDLFERSESLFE